MKIKTGSHSVNQLILTEKRNAVQAPDAKDGYLFLAKKKSLSVLHFDLMMLPFPVHRIIFEHICLRIIIQFRKSDPWTTPSELKQNNLCFKLWQYMDHETSNN